MLVLNTNAKTARAEIVDNKAVIKYDDDVRMFVVASTKGKNAILDSLKYDSYVPNEIEEKEIFFDRYTFGTMIAQNFEALVDTQKTNIENFTTEEKKEVLHYVLDCINKGCVFYRAIRRSK